MPMLIPKDWPAGLEKGKGMDKIRLQKYMAEAGIASRRKAEELILEGKVTVNGEPVTELGVKIDPNRDKVKYKGKLVLPDKRQVVYVFNKPLGVLSASSDDRGRKVISDYFSGEHRLFPVGRLDINTEGLILVTNDGDLTYRLTHPKYEIDKLYEVLADGPLSYEKKSELERGCDIGPYSISGSRIRLIKREAGGYRYLVTIHEGKNRQVRNMFEYAGLTVRHLKRVAIGELRLGNLRPGQHRGLSRQEAAYLKRILS